MKKIIMMMILAFALFMTPVYAQETYTITITLDHVYDVSPSHLEGWVIMGDEKLSFGKFSVDDMMGASTKSFMVDVDISMADAVVITIEPEGDTDAIPSGIVLLSGSLNDHAGKLEFPVSFDSIGGTYILATPSNGADTDENSGIWYLEIPDPSPGLDLPELPSGWVYEGWVVNGGVPITSGRFTDTADMDMFDGYSASTNYPPFPGEDFLMSPPMDVMFPFDLGDGSSKAVISVEPDLMGVDPTGDGPFSIKPLIADIPDGAMDHVNYDMMASTATVPTGLVVVGFDSMSLMSMISDLEEQLTGLESMITELEDEIEMREMDMMEPVTVPLGSWQAVSAVALIIGLAIGYAVVSTRNQ